MRRIMAIIDDYMWFELNPHHIDQDMDGRKTELNCNYNEQKSIMINSWILPFNLGSHDMQLVSLIARVIKLVY